MVTERFALLQNELHESPEWNRLSTIRQFATSLELFQRNRIDLQRLLAAGESEQGIEQLGPLRNRDILDEYQIEVLRRFVNFVMSAFALVDHARRFIRTNYQEGQFSDYESEVTARFAADPLSQFVQGLRNFGTHRRPFTLVSKFEIDVEREISHRQYLRKQELEEWDGWNTAARAYLAATAPEIYLADPIKEYADKVQRFYAWVFARLQQIHAKDIAAVDAKQAEAQLEFGHHLPALLRSHMKRDGAAGGNPDELFAGFVAPARLREIVAIPDARARACAFVDEVKSWAPGVADLTEEIVHFFVAAKSRQGTPDGS